ncbi:MAG: hypothetical protein IPG86_19760 [Chitinophagaceae bacterium]|nr:hypothetical protein [Chitinophagaceae bacterium]
MLNTLQDLNCGKVHVAQLSSDAFTIQHEATTLEGYVRPENFPACCGYHTNIVKSANEFMAKFPQCCPSHQNLLSAPWFKKSNYTDIPDKLLTTLSHTEHHIHHKINEATWYKDITDFFEYAISSFGQLPEGFGAPVGLHLYFYHLDYYIKDRKEIPSNKKKRLLDYLNNYNKREVLDPTDINKLIETYKKWVNTFPFEISYFSHLKPLLEKRIPLLAEKAVENPYIGLFKAKLQTLKGLVSFLVGVTEKILSEINSMILAEKGLLTDPEKIRLEVVNANRRLELKHLNDRPGDERRQYLRILKQWFAGEKRYLKEVTPLLDKLSPAGTAPKKENPVDINDQTGNLFCNAMPLQVAIDHFRVFTEQKSTNGKPFLTKKQLNAFIARAFCGQTTIVKQTFNCSSREKLFIVKRFHQLYSLAAGRYENTTQCTPKYIKLLTDNFTNWNHSAIKHNFGNRVKRNW